MRSLISMRVRSCILIGAIAACAFIVLSTAGCRSTPEWTRQPTEELVARAPAPVLAERERMLMHALTAEPVDMALLKRALRDIIEVNVSYRRPLYREAVSKVGWRKDGRDDYESTSVVLWDPNLPSEDWPSQLAAPLAKGFLPSHVCLAFLPPPNIVPDRDRLLTEADAKIRTGLMELAKTFPQIRPKDIAGVEKSPAAISRPGHVSIHVGPFYNGLAGRKRPVPEDKRYGLGVFLEPVQARFYTQRMMRDLFPSIGLIGQVSASARDPELDAALKKLVRDALAPLADLDTKARQQLQESETP